MNTLTTHPQNSPFPATPCQPEACATPAAASAQLLTQAQLAARLGISRRTLANWIRNKTVPMIKIAGYCRFDFDKVRAALERHEQAVVVAGVAATSPESTRGINH
jgi:excisionase family DNA binding protein